MTFWCVHSSGSKYVEREWQTGLRAGKRLLPVLLDNTALPDALGRYQGVDFRRLVTDSHKSDVLNAFNPLAIFVLPLMLIWMLLQAIVGAVTGSRERRGDSPHLSMARLLGERLAVLWQTEPSDIAD